MGNVIYNAELHKIVLQKLKNYKILKTNIKINIDNINVVEIFGVNNENLNFFEDQLPIKIFQKGNQINIKRQKSTTIYDIPYFVTDNKNLVTTIKQFIGCLIILFVII